MIMDIIKKPKIYKIDHGKVYNFSRPKNFYLELKKNDRNN